MKSLALAGALALVLSSPAVACYEWDSVVGTAPPTVQITEIPAADLPRLVADLEAKTGTKYEGVTRGFIALEPPALAIIGLEIDGCVLPPIDLTTLPPPGPAALLNEGARDMQRDYREFRHAKLGML